MKFLLPLVLILLMFAQVAMLDGPPREAMREFDHHYVLVARHGGTCSRYAGNDSFATSQCWVYDQQDFDDKASALAELNSANGGFPKYHPFEKGNGYNYEFIGIFELKRVVGPDDLKFSEGDHVQTHTVEEKDHWFKWEPK